MESLGYVRECGNIKEFDSLEWDYKRITFVLCK